MKRLVTSPLPAQRRKTPVVRPQSTKTPPDRVFKFRRAFDGHASFRDRSGWVELSAPIPRKPLPAASAVVEKGERKWLVAGMVRGKHQTAGPQSPESLGQTHSYQRYERRPGFKVYIFERFAKKKKMILDMKGLRRLNYKLTQKIQKQKGSTLIDLYPALHASQKYSFCRSSPAQKIPLCRDPSPFIQGSP